MTSFITLKLRRRVGQLGWAGNPIVYYYGQQRGTTMKLFDWFMVVSLGITLTKDVLALVRSAVNVFRHRG